MDEHWDLGEVSGVLPGVDGPGGVPGPCREPGGVAVVCAREVEAPGVPVEGDACIIRRVVGHVVVPRRDRDRGGWPARVFFRDSGGLADRAVGGAQWPLRVGRRVP